MCPPEEDGVSPQQPESHSPTERPPHSGFELALIFRALGIGSWREPKGNLRAEDNQTAPEMQIHQHLDALNASHEGGATTRQSYFVWESKRLLLWNCYEPILSCLAQEMATEFPIRGVWLFLR